MKQPIDFIIIGAGIAGLYTAYQIKRFAPPNTTFLILEKNKKEWMGGWAYRQRYILRRRYRCRRWRRPKVQRPCVDSTAERHESPLFGVRIFAKLRPAIPTHRPYGRNSNPQNRI